jgi:hypothetical protein
VGVYAEPSQLGLPWHCPYRGPAGFLQDGTAGTDAPFLGAGAGAEAGLKGDVTSDTKYCRVGHATDAGVNPSHSHLQRHQTSNTFSVNWTYGRTSG